MTGLRRKRLLHLVALGLRLAAKVDGEPIGSGREYVPDLLVKRINSKPRQLTGH